MFLLSFLLSIAGSAQAATTAENSSAPPVIRIGVASEAPFAREDAGQWRGLSPDLWQAVSRRSGVRLEWVRVDSGTTAQQIADQKIDVGPIGTITAERLQQLEFSLPVLPAGLAIATLATNRWDWHSFFSQAWDSGLVMVIVVMLAINAIVGFALWQIERRRNPANFGGKPAEGIASAIWCSVTTMTTVGYGDKVPVTAAGRIVCFLMMLSGVVAISLFTASATSVLTVSHLRPRVQTVADLKHASTVAVDGSGAAEYLQRNRLPFIRARSFAEASRLLEHGDAVAFVHPRVELRAGFQNHPGHLVILPITLEEQFFAFPLTSDPKLRRWINRAMQEVLDSPEWDRITLTYLRE